jgi:hypothetical protein
MLTITPPLPCRRLAALGLLLALVACGGGPAPTVPSTAPTVAATTRTTAPMAGAPTPVAAPATPATAPRVATAPAPATPIPATRAAMAGTPAAIATRGASAPTATVVAPTTTPAPTPRGYAPGDPCAPYATAAPARLCIPALALSAPVVPVGATPEGAMAESPDPWAVGWYAPGPPPGAPAVFWELDRLRAGDVLVVVDAAGVARRFVVLENAVYLRDDAPLTKVFGPADDANLALITGAGTWEPVLGVYDSNRIIFARMQP